MNKSKNHNSILFLTTLGVYLGLVLVGATPVLGHAATTRNFELQDEIEVKDDLDNQPDIEEIKTFLEVSFEPYVSQFIQDLRDFGSLSQSSRLDKDLYSVFSEHYFCSENQVERRGSEMRATAAFTPYNGLLQRLDLASNWKFSDVPSFIKAPETYIGAVQTVGFCKSFGVDAGLSSSEVYVKVKFSRESSLGAFDVVVKLNEYFADRDDLQSDPLTKQILERTRATSNYTEVLVVTRLPRAGLDSLLAKSAK